MIGLRPFLGVRSMHLSDSSLVLLASSTTGGTVDQQQQPPASWTVYHLRLPSPLQLTNDLCALAAQHRADSRTTFALLAAEAHMVARVALEYLRVQRYGNVAHLGAVTGGGAQLRAAYVETCRLLGDCCLGAAAKEDYAQAFGYYAMAEMGVADVLRRALRPAAVAERRRGGGGASEAGLVHTMRCMLLKGFLRQDQGVLAAPIDRRGPFVDALLELLLAEAPDEVAPLMLRVPTLRDAASAKWCAAIRSKQRRTAEDRLCLLWESVRLGVGAAAAGDDAEQPSDAVELYTVLIAHWTILFDSVVVKKTGRRLTSFSELTESHLLATQSPATQRAVTNALVHLTVDAQLIGVDVLLRLLLDYLASRVVAHPGGGSQTAQLVLATLLEAHFYRRHLRDDGSAVGGGGVGVGGDHKQMAQVVQLGASSSSSDELTSNSATSSSGNSSSARRVVVVGSSAGSGLAHQMRSSDVFLYGEAVHAEAIKILVRLYLGQLKRFEMQSTLKPAVQPVVSAAMVI